MEAYLLTGRPEKVSEGCEEAIEEEEEDEEAEEITEKEEPKLISTEKKVNHLCKCWSKEPTIKFHTKEVFSDGWTRLVCSQCGKVKFKRGKEAEAE